MISIGAREQTISLTAPPTRPHWARTTTPHGASISSLVVATKEPIAYRKSIFTTSGTQAASVIFYCTLKASAIH
ncbi:hypothetical protein Pla8534_03970 [Lignipirellula cremea]|uniref:Uncharacterized protein n=1 Tax=Lignipirellula cremea TaxID=2528010 RepID=A0A518DLE3_9BACT|nr:hypothetical protein Pla8534_03970 [Lignipirellula cremea]